MSESLGGCTDEKVRCLVWPGVHAAPRYACGALSCLSRQLGALVYTLRSAFELCVMQMFGIYDQMNCSPWDFAGV